jgi:XTP/dITP diphosphohydrolase
MNKLLIGTANKAKLNTYKKLLKDFSLELTSLEDLKITDEAEETGKNFEEIAIQKAKFYYKKSGIPTLVDDGGFEVEALNGEPGVKSKRWLGHKATDQELINVVIERMKEVPDGERRCKMTVVVALASPFGIMTSHADVEGIVAKKSSNSLQSGFPYRSVMMIPNYGKYYSELTNEELQILDHRGHAIEKIKDLLREISK